MARQLGVCPETVALWEKGRARPLPRYYAGIVRFLDYDPESEAEVPGPRLRARRRRLGLTQRELAARLGLDPGTVADVERGRRRVSRRVAEVVASLLRSPGDEGETPVT